MEQEIFIKESLGIINNLKCCGNCDRHYKDCQHELSYEYCSKWQSDTLGRSARTIKAPEGAS